MNKIGLIIKREYLRRVKKRSFVLLTLLSPLLMTALIFVPLWLSSIKGSEKQLVVIDDRTERYLSLFTELEGGSDSYLFMDKRDHDALPTGEGDKVKEVFATLEISGDLLANPHQAKLYSFKQIPGDLERTVNRTLKAEIEREKIASFNIPDLAQIIEDSKVRFEVQTIKLSEDGTQNKGSAQLISIIGMGCVFLSYLFIMMYGAMVMQGVSEEKTNRIVEIMVSSVKPFDLMMGKIIGIGLVGLTQLFLWGVIIALLSSVGSFFLGAGSMGAMASLTEHAVMEQLLSINLLEIMLFFVLFFIGGYLIYASLFSAIGSVIDHPEDAQQFMTPVVLILVFALYAGIYSIENPEGPLAFWCSMIPLTSPMVMMMRIPYVIPLWQKLLSLVLLYGTATCFIYLSGRIYRIGILMYGKKPSFKEIGRWLTFR